VVKLDTKKNKIFSENIPKFLYTYLEINRELGLESGGAEMVNLENKKGGSN
jgi:hypothetical protein